MDNFYQIRQKYLNIQGNIKNKKSHKLYKYIIGHEIYICFIGRFLIIQFPSDIVVLQEIIFC